MGKAFSELVHIACPSSAEHVHRLIRAKGKMSIADGVKSHPITSYFNISSTQFSIADFSTTLLKRR